MRLRSATVGLAGLLLLAACGGAAGPDPQVAKRPGTTTTAAPPTEPSAPSDLVGPPPVIVRFLGDSIALQAWTYCYRYTCVDGMPPADPPDVASPDEVVIEFPLASWSFTASFQPAGDECGRVQEVQLEPVDDGRFVLRPTGPAGTYDVMLFGRGNGDLVTTFRWTTPVDGPLATPRARLAVLAGHDGRVDSYGVELELENLARTPRQASARITVRSADGEAITFHAKRSRLRCLPVGTVYWDGPDERGRAAAALGKGPFTYEVELVLDGARFVATATWPADEIAGNEPSAALHFSPDLPAPS